MLIRNQMVVHGRTPFFDDAQYTRCLARKWFVQEAAHQHYRHAPSLAVHTAWVEAFPEFFDESRTDGDWSYSATTGTNNLNR